MTRSVFSRLILLTLGILTIAGAAGAMRVKHWTPIDAFLEHRNTTPVIGSTMTADLRPSSTMALNHRSFGTFDPDALAPGGFVTGTAGKLNTGTRADSAGWADDRLPGASSAGAAGATASLGGLWRLMGLAHGQDHAAATSTTHSTATHTAAPKPTTHASAPHTTSPTVATPVATIAQVTTPAILIGNNATSVSGLISGPSTLTGGSITPGATKTGLGAGTGVSGFSATPEPGSALLFGTGLFLLSMMLRRRRT